MAKVSVKFVSIGSAIDFYVAGDAASKAAELKAAGAYAQGPVFETAEVGKDAAEEAFDLSNNPCREDERAEKYGRCRSVSVGDIVEVDGDEFLCMSVGWKKM